MDNNDIYKVTNQFFANGCKYLSFDQCEKLHADFLESLGGGGCSACKRRKMKNKYSRILHDVIRELKYEDVRNVPDTNQ